MNGTDTLIVMITATIVGIITLLLVANELGKRAKLGYGGRLVLAGGLGLGVIAFSIKVGVYVYLNSLNSGDMAVFSAWKHLPPARFHHAPVVRHMTQERNQPGFRVWQSLPTQAPAPADNPASAAKIALGKTLFFDQRLSVDNTVSCASCHRLENGGDDDAPVSTGIRNLKGNRNAPTVLNAAFLSRLFWDGRAASLEEQAKGPLVNPVEMGMKSYAAVEQKVRSIKSYRTAFKKVFGTENSINIANIAKSIAAYERTLISPQAPFDRFVNGDATALSAQQIRGMALFDTIGCRNCHVDPTFSSAGLVKPFGTYRPFPVFPGKAFIAKYDLLVDGKQHMWRVPSLRNVAQTAPYFHNGSVKTLEEAIRVMAVSQLNKRLSNHPADDISISHGAVGKTGNYRRLTLLQNQALSDSEVDDIAAFLRSLSGELTLP